MERLTDRTENGLICLNNNGNCGFIEQLIKAIDKLAEFEDFIEGQGFEDLQDLERYIEQTIKASELLDKKMKENQALKDKIQELELADFIRRKEK